MFYPPTRPLVRGLRNEVHRAFTLIELLVVIGIIGILSAITFGIIKGVNERADLGQAKAELASLAQSLEEYKRQYGDYPQKPTAAVFLQSLIGGNGPTGISMSPKGKSFIEVSKFTTSADPFTDTTATLQDPWGRSYNYYYKTTGTWTNKTYVLYSFGPTIGATSTATTEPTTAQPNASGIVNYLDSSNLDNIYSNQN